MGSVFVRWARVPVQMLEVEEALLELRDLVAAALYMHALRRLLAPMLVVAPVRVFPQQLDIDLAPQPLRAEPIAAHAPPRALPSMSVGGRIAA
jgi:hypothetical protein